jgi:hypothetical protein
MCDEIEWVAAGVGWQQNMLNTQEYKKKGV